MDIKALINVKQSFINLSFPDLSTVLEGMITETYGQFSCNTCAKVMAQKRDMKRHVECHLDINHECNICGQRSKTSNALRMHYRNNHKAVKDDGY